MAYRSLNSRLVDPTFSPPERKNRRIIFQLESFERYQDNLDPRVSVGRRRKFESIQVFDVSQVEITRSSCRC